MWSWCWTTYWTRTSTRPTGTKISCTASTRPKNWSYSVEIQIKTNRNKRVIQSNCTLSINGGWGDTTVAAYAQPTASTRKVSVFELDSCVGSAWSCPLVWLNRDLCCLMVEGLCFEWLDVAIVIIRCFKNDGLNGWMSEMTESNPYSTISLSNFQTYS